MEHLSLCTQKTNSLRRPIAVHSFPDVVDRCLVGWTGCRPGWQGASGVMRSTFWQNAPCPGAFCMLTVRCYNRFNGYSCRNSHNHHPGCAICTVTPSGWHTIDPIRSQADLLSLASAAHIWGLADAGARDISLTRCHLVGAFWGAGGLPIFSTFANSNAIANYYHCSNNNIVPNHYIDTYDH